MRCLTAAFIVALLLSVLCPLFYGENAEKVVDSANLLTEEQEERLQTACVDFVEQYGLDIVVVTIDDNQGKSSTAYADDYYDYNGYGLGDDCSGLLLLIDMDARNLWISTTGEGIRVYTDTRIDRMLDDIYGYVAEEDYFSGAMAFILSAGKYAAQGVTSDQYNYDTETGESDPYYQPDFWKTLLKRMGQAALGSLVLTLIVVIAVRGSKGKKETVNATTYLDSHNYHLYRKQDSFLRTSVSKTRINDSNSGGGGGGGRSSTHSGSSGTSHGGGGRSF